MRTRVLVGTAVAVWALAAFVDPSPRSGLSLVTPAYAQQGRTMPGVTRTGSGRMSLDVQGAEIRTVLRSIAEFSGKNIVVGKEVKGQVSIQLKDVRWQDALIAVARTQSLDFIDEGGIIRVDTADRLQAEVLARETNEARRLEVQPLTTRVIKLDYANASELRTALASVVSKRGVVDIDNRTNSLIVTDLESRLDGIEEFAKQLDTRTPQVEITAKLVDIDVNALRELGVRWGVSNLDINHLSSPDPATFLGGTGNIYQPQIGVDAGVPGNIGSIAGVLTRPWGTVEFLIEALELDRKAQIISNPRITTVDNREAKILVGQKIPLIVQDVAGNAVTQLQTIGIQLKVTPHLTADKKIQLDLKPEISDLSSQSTVQGGVIINTSEADTRVLVDDGQTAVIGGLIRTNEGKIMTGVPGLMHIPILGNLFRSTSTAKSQRELVIFVTPKLVEALADASDEARRFPAVGPSGTLREE
jgi:type IV pilus assembly protein PilQ